MKKIFFIAVSALTALFASCNMDKFPHDSILESEGVKTMSDAEQLRVSIYTPMKGLIVGARHDIEELRGGLFNAMADFGNAYGTFHSWRMQVNDTDVESLWYSDYAIITSVNYAIGAYEKLLADTESGLTEDNKAAVSMYLAEAHVTRALAYWDLVTKYCVAYDPDLHEGAEDHLGLPLTTVYNPTSDVSQYPGRSSLKETYDLIIDDLSAALEIPTLGTTNSNYFTKDVVKALLARVQLNMKDWTNAARNAQEIINTNTYTLASSAGDLEGLYNLDTSNELLFVVAGSKNDTPGSTGSLYIYDTEKRDGSTPDPQYIPSQTLIDLYDAENDMRYPIFFKTKTITVENAGTDDLELMWKFVGNRNFRTNETQLNYINAGKIRISEMYLTLAEAAANMGGEGLSVAQSALNTLRASRINGYVDESYAERDLMPAIKAEWTREFVGEGFRMINLKRWNDDMVRGDSQNSAMTKAEAGYDGLEKSMSDARCLWPIPKKEMDINPQIKGQQNEGYN